MSYARLLVLVALGVVLASPAFPQSPEAYQGRAVASRPVTITTAGGRSYIVGVQRPVLLEPVELPTPPTPRKVTTAKEPAAKAAP